MNSTGSLANQPLYSWPTLAIKPFKVYVAAFDFQWDKMDMGLTFCAICAIACIGCLSIQQAFS
jgi:hypothetical protein